MDTSLASNLLAFHALLDPAKSLKDSPIEILQAVAERRGEGTIASNGAFVALTGEYTGRSPKDKFIVVDDETRASVAWGEINQAMQLEVFDRLAERFLGDLKGKKIFVEYVRACADPTYQLRVRLISEFSWHALFAKQLFRRAQSHASHSISPDFPIVAAPTLQARPVVAQVR